MGLPSIIGQCWECCASYCPSPTVEWDSRSASKSKYGYSEMPGHASTPPKRYKKVTETVSGSMSSYYTSDSYVLGGSMGTACLCCTSREASSVWAWGGSQVSTRSEGDVTTHGPTPADGTWVMTDSETVTESFYEGACSPHFSTDTYPVAWNYNPLTAISQFVDEWHCGDPSITYTATKSTVHCTGSETDGPGMGGTGACGCPSGNLTEKEADYTRVIEYSDEYSTDALITDTLAALPAFDDDWDDTSGSSRNLTTNELTFSVREAKYRFRFQIPTSRKRVNTCYVLEWVERFTPLGGGAATDTPKTWTWDGTIPEDYDADDSATWPLSPEYTISIPEANGTTTVAELEAICDECE